MGRAKKFLIWLIVLLIPSLLVGWQNSEFFLEKKIIKLNLYFDKFQTPEMPIALFFLTIFFAGLLIAYFSSLFEKFAARKTIRKLNDEVTTAKKMISELEIANESMKAAAKSAGHIVSSGPAEVPGGSE